MDAARLLNQMLAGEKRQLVIEADDTSIWRG
jgi:hypothetical protein